MYTESPSQVPQIHIAKETLAKSLAHLREEWQGLETRLSSVVVPLNRGPEGVSDSKEAKPMSPTAMGLYDAIKVVDEIANQIVDVKRRLEI